MKNLEMEEKNKMKQKYLVVSIHDATPEFKTELGEIVSELDRNDILKRSVLVIPDYLGKNNLLHNDGFIDWLHQIQDKGNEIVQHGYEHVSTNKDYHSLYGKFVGERLAHGCGEFQNISREEANSKIQQGENIFNQIGIYPKGFVAPGWLLNKESEKAIKDEGFTYTTTFKNIEFFLQQRTEKSEIIVFTSGKGIINKGFEIYNNRLLKKNFKKRRIARVAIHPQDLKNPRLFEFTLDAIKQLRKERKIITYADLLN